MLAGINAFLDTDFSHEDMELIYTYMGSGIKHGLTLVFIDHDMSMKWLRNHIPENWKRRANGESAYYYKNANRARFAEQEQMKLKEL